MSRRSYSTSYSRIRDTREENRLLRGISLAAAVAFSALVGLQLDRKRFSVFGTEGGPSSLSSDSMASLGESQHHGPSERGEAPPKVFGRAPAWFVEAPELESLRGDGVIEYTLGASLREDFSLSAVDLKTSAMSKGRLFAMRLTPNRQGTYEIRITDRELKVLFLSRDAGTVLLYESTSSIPVAELSFTSTKNGLSIVQNGSSLYQIQGVSFEKSKVSFISNCCSTEVTGFKVAGTLNGKEFAEEL